ncbi:MAG: ATP-binding protein [Syntrophobacteraceae bacterium]|jgi:two-component system phosphate regulon sensor histidine kinase PhoR
MRLKFRLRVRLLLLLWVIFFLALFLPSLYYNKYLKDEILSETEARASRELTLIKNLMAREDFHGPEHLHAWLRKVSDPLNVRITYVAEGGRVIADTGVPFDQASNLENLAKRPEIAEAYNQPTGSSLRYSNELNTDLLFVAQRIEGRGTIPGGALRVAVPLSGIFYSLSNVAIVQHLIILTGFIAFALISFGLMVSASRSVSLLSSAADSIGHGDVKVLPQFHHGHYFYPLAKSIRENAERVESYIQTITEQKSQLESILDGIEEGILLLNSAGRIDSSNRAARSMFSSIPELKGRRPLEVIRSPELQAACNRILENEIHSFHSEVAFGVDRFYHVHIVRIEQSKGQVGAIIALHDISELKRLETVRRDFVANASHELRTPLTSIKGYTEVLMSEDDPEVRSPCLEVIFKNANHMIKIVNDLLQLAKVEDYNTIMDIRPVKVDEVLIEAWKACAPAAEQRSVSLQNDLPPDVPRVQADFDQLVQVFRNLLENAVKYSPPGAKVEVFSLTQDGKVTIGVSDSGPGIPRKDQQRIFERFFRVERYRGKETGSTGLGLAICRHIVRIHGGSIWVESPRKDISSGSTFFFTLPSAEREETVS